MSDLQIVLRDMGILDAAEAKAKALGTSIEGALRMWVCDETEALLRKRAEEYAGRQVTDEELALFKEFGTTWLSEVPPSAVEEWGNRYADR